jgi:long-chain acyl-CoA synthetase
LTVVNLEECRILSDIISLGSYVSGNRVAIKHEGVHLNYTDLSTYTKGFTSYLKKQGLQKGDRLVIILENSLEYVIALFGAFGVGAAVIPINPDTTANTVNHITLNSKANGIITRDRILHQLGITESDVPTISLFKEDFNANVDHFFCDLEPDLQDALSISQIHGNDLAMVIYTSGTTGRPKGVMLSHNNLLTNTRSIVQYLKLTPEDSIVNVLPFFYSFGNSVLMTHLAVKGCIVIENHFMYPNKVIQTMQKERPTGFAGVPSNFYILFKKTNFLKFDWSFLRYISQAGGGMRVETIRQLDQVLSNTEIYIMYGQTEASARLSYLDPALIKKKIGSIGKGMPGVELRVVNESGQDVDSGKIGEIIARGDNIMMGYLDNPEATSRTIRDGWLYTGDMVRCDEDGFIYIVNRKSDFIKSASYRISPGEIEEVIAEIEGVVDVAVIGVDDELLGEAIVACVNCTEEAFDAHNIFNYCIDRLPFYKVPVRFIHESNIPLTASGKKRYNVLRDKYKKIG